MSEALQQQLEEEVKNHNDLLEQVNKIREQVKSGENQLFIIQGRVQILQEQIQNGQVPAPQAEIIDTIPNPVDEASPEDKE